jgi:hypothetical protein
MPSPGRKNQESVLVKRNQDLLAHAAVTEYDVVAAEHAFHELRLAAIAAGRSTSQATTHVTPRSVVSQTTSYARREEARHTAERVDALQTALAEIRHRATEHPLHAHETAGDTVKHRGAAARAVDLENKAIAQRIFNAHAAVPTLPQLLRAEKERAAACERLQTLPRVTPRQVPREELQLRERNFILDAADVASPSSIVPLPPITDRRGHTFTTPRPPKSSRNTTAPRPNDHAATSPAGALTARAPLRLPTKAARLPVTARADRPLHTRLTLAELMTRNPRSGNAGTWINPADNAKDEHGARAKYHSAETLAADEAEMRGAVDAKQRSQFHETIETVVEGSRDEAKARQAAREARDAAAAAERRDLESLEAELRGDICGDEGTARDTLQSLEPKRRSDAEEAAKTRTERDRQKARRRFEGCEADEDKQRTDIGAEEDAAHAAIKKKWRRLVVDAEEQTALKRRQDAIRRVLSQLDKDDDAVDVVLVPSGAETSTSRPSWQAARRLCVSADGQQLLTMSRSNTEGGAIDDALFRFRVLEIGDGYVALAVAGDTQTISPTAPAGDSKVVSRTLVTTEEGSSTSLSLNRVTLGDGPTHGAHVFEIVLDLDEPPTAARWLETFTLVPRDRADSVVALKAAGKAADAPSLALSSAGAAVVLALLPAAAVVADAALDQAEADQRAAEAAAEAERVATETRRQRAVEALGCDPATKPTVELFVAAHPELRVQRSTEDDRGKLRVGERTRSALDKFTLTFVEGGYVMFTVDGGAGAVAVTAPGPGKAGALRAEAISEDKKDLAAFEVVSGAASGRCCLRPKLQAACFVEAQPSSEQKKLAVIPQADAQDALCEFIACTVVSADAWHEEQDRKKRDAEAQRAAPAQAAADEEAAAAKKKADEEAQAAPEPVAVDNSEEAANQNATAAAAAEEGEAAAAERREKKDRKEAAARKRRDAAFAAVGTEAALEARTEYELAMASDINLRLLWSEQGAVVAGSRSGTARDRFVPTVDADGYLALHVEGGSKAVIVSADGQIGVAPLDPATAESRQFEVLFLNATEELGGTVSASAAHDRFVLRPRAWPRTVVEADLETDGRPLVLVTEDDASNFGEFIFVTLEAAALWQSNLDAAAAHEKAVEARTAAMIELIGDPELMTVYEVYPAAHPDLRLHALDHGPVMVQPRGPDLSEASQFVFVDVSDGYVNVVPLSAPEGVVAYYPKGGFGKDELVVEKGAAVDTSPSEHGTQLFEIVLRDNGHFSLVPKDHPQMVLALREDLTGLTVVPAADAGATAEFHLTLREEASLDAKSSSNGSPFDTSPERADGAELGRAEIVKSILGDLEEMDVWEVMPADKPRQRLGMIDPEDEDVGDAPGDLVFRSRKGVNTEQFIFTDAGDGYVHIIPWADTTMAVEVDAESHAVMVRPLDAGSVWQAFEMVLVPRSPSRKDDATRFLLAPRAVPSVILDITDDEQAPIALMPDTSLSPMAELTVLTRDQAEAQAAMFAEKRSLRRQSKIDPQTRARLQACGAIFGDDFDVPVPVDTVEREVNLAPVDDDARRLTLVPDAAGVSSFRVVASAAAAIAVLRVRNAGLGYVALSADCEGGGRWYLRVDPVTGAISSFKIGDAAERPPEECQFEVMLLEGEGSFCLAPRAPAETVIEAQLNEDGSLVVVPASDASTFGEFHLVVAA